jgi:hypothetical protein
MLLHSGIRGIRVFTIWIGSLTRCLVVPYKPIVGITPATIILKKTFFMVNFGVSLLEGREVERPTGRSMLYEESIFPTAGGEFQNSILIIDFNRVKILAKDNVFRYGDVKIVSFRIPIHTIKM